MGPAEVYTAGVELFRQGSPPRQVYLIRRGLVKLVALGASGSETILGLRYSGWMLGASAVVIREPYPATGITLTDCNLHRIEANSFLRLIATNARFSWHLHEMNSREIYDQVMQLTALITLSARERLEHLLWELAAEQNAGERGGGIRLEVPLRQREIAQLVAVSPQYLSILLNQLEQAGLIRRRKGWIIVSDPQRLWHRSDI